MENKKCIIVHGCPSTPETMVDLGARYDQHWIAWTKKQLNDKNLATEAPLMPTPWEPDYDKFKNEFEKYNTNENTILIGHSCGCAFLVRWLGETKRKIFKLILVAPWKIATKERIFREQFYNYSIDETIKDRVEEIVMFTSNNEEDAGKESLKIFHDVLGGKIIELQNHGHFTMKDMGTVEFPELLEEVLNK
ncbi:MAG: alpha/beta hydrolase [Patescibacteria group bacterium]|jgi:hypothetical protein